MYLAQTFKLRYGEIADFFQLNPFPLTGVRFMKERVVYFLYIDGKLSGPYKTYGDCRATNLAFEMLEMLQNNLVLVIEPRQVAQEVISKKIYLRTAIYEDIERNTIFFEHQNKHLYGPYQMHTDISEHDADLIKKINTKLIFVINERQNF